VSNLISKDKDKFLKNKTTLKNKSK